MLFFHHAGKTSSIPPPAGGLSTAIVVVARRWKEYHVVAAVEGHELKAPETEHRPGLERLLETAHLELDGKLFVNTQQAPTWRANCRRFETGGSLGVGNLRTCFVETSVVYTHPPFPPFLSHKHTVGKPFEMEYLLDEPCHH
jgi:hypothetical protein